MSTITAAVPSLHQPDAKPARIEAYDVARALAILGMIIVNFKLVMGSSSAGPGWLIFPTSLLEGRAAALFVVLAGVSLSLLSRRAFIEGDQSARHDARRRVLRRSAFLLVFGLLLALIWPADILHFYSLYLALGAALLFVPVRQLWWAMIAVMVVFQVLFFIMDYDAGWDWDTLTITDFWTAPGIVRHLLFNGFHPLFPWSAFLILGMWLGRQDVLDPAVRRQMIATGTIVLTSVEVISAAMVALASPHLGTDLAVALFGRNMIPPLPLYMLSAGSTAMIVVLLLVELSQHFGSSRWWRVLATTGQFALTLYVAHIVIGMGIIQTLGWIDSGQPLGLATLYSLAFYAGCITFVGLWHMKFQRGPFEALLRHITD